MNISIGKSEFPGKKFSSWTVSTAEFNILAGLVGAVGKISASQPQGPQFDPRLCQDLNICVTFFPGLSHLSFPSLRSR